MERPNLAEYLVIRSDVGVAEVQAGQDVSKALQWLDKQGCAVNDTTISRKIVISKNPRGACFTSMLPENLGGNSLKIKKKTTSYLQIIYVWWSLRPPS